MKKIVIFSGTTEGRRLSEMLAEEKINHTVCVATGYGREMMDENPYADVKVGRLKETEMCDFFARADMGQDDIVIDATHPYAAEVTANISRAAGAMSIPVIRILRSEENADRPFVRTYPGIKECAEAIDLTEGNILLTTGSKELEEYCVNISEETKERTYVRVLPSSESIALCERQKIASDHILAMQGPFSAELNEALIRRYEIRHLITKESGSAGGFTEKVSAAERTGTMLHVIRRPQEVTGISVEEAFLILTGKEANDAAEVRISLIGLGMGDAKWMTKAAEEAIEDSGIVFGAKRLLQGIRHPKKVEMYLPSDILPVLKRERVRHASVVYSGDTGFYSGARQMIEACEVLGKDVKTEVIPGISSVSYLAAKLQEHYDDACLFSIHGKGSNADLQALTERVLHHEKVFVLLSDAKDVASIANRLIGRGVKGQIVIGRDLSYETETIEELSLEEAAAYENGGLATALIRNDACEKRLLIPVKDDSDFIREKVPMTKACVRHESIIRLNLREGDVFYDIGGGTGSVAIEAAALHDSLRVYTIERKPEAIELIRRNVDRAGLTNVTVIEGDALEELTRMQKPDCVFIGGSGGQLSGIVKTLHEKGGGIRFVITAVTLETTEEVRKLIEAYAPDDAGMIMLSVSEVHQAGASHLMQAQNPVWIFSFTL